MSIECFEVSFEKEVYFLIADLNQQFRDESLLSESVYHDRITSYLL